jgi:murein DD-endopeptidase MepM/ murein hydrolase activator NlpD
MTWKISHYNQLRADFDRLRTRYADLQRVSRQHTEQMASLESLASEVSVAYGINEPKDTSNPVGTASSDPETQKVAKSLDEFNILAGAAYSDIYHRYAYQWQNHTRPSLWPVNGVLRSAFGGRTDPFSGEGAFHTGVDLAAPVGTQVRVTADGVVARVSWAGAYGRLIVVDHGNGLQTYYAHLSQFLVLAGQEVRRGEVIALSGGTGRATGPHMHYEVRVSGTPINPYKYLAKADVNRVTRHASSDLGL